MKTRSWFMCIKILPNKCLPRWVVKLKYIYIYTDGRSSCMPVEWRALGLLSHTVTGCGGQCLVDRPASSAMVLMNPSSRALVTFINKFTNYFFGHRPISALMAGREKYWFVALMICSTRPVGYSRISGSRMNHNFSSPFPLLHSFGFNKLMC